MDHTHAARLSLQQKPKYDTHPAHEFTTDKHMSKQRPWLKKVTKNIS